MPHSRNSKLRIDLKLGLQNQNTMFFPISKIYYWFLLILVPDSRPAWEFSEQEQDLLLQEFSITIVFQDLHLMNSYLIQLYNPFRLGNTLIDEYSIFQPEKLYLSH